MAPRKVKLSRSPKTGKLVAKEKAEKSPEKVCNETRKVGPSQKEKDLAATVERLKKELDAAGVEMEELKAALAAQKRRAKKISTEAEAERVRQGNEIEWLRGRLR